MARMKRNINHKVTDFANDLKKRRSNVFSWLKAELTERLNISLPQQDSHHHHHHPNLDITGTKFFLLGTGSTDPPPFGIKDRPPDAGLKQ